MNGAVRILMVLAIVAAGAGVAGGQPRGRGEAGEMAVSVAWLAPFPLGTTAATLVQPDGSPLTLFRTENSLTRGFGLSVDAGRRVGRSTILEATGAWSRSKLRTIVAGDVENAAGAVIDAPLTRVTVEGGAAWTIGGTPRASYFVRAAGGWMAELPDDASATSRGWVGSLGAGVKYWGAGAQGSAGRVGVKIEGRAVIRRRGVIFGERAYSLAPAISGGLLLRF